MAIVGLAIPTSASPAAMDAETDYVFAGGGTPLSNGAFFPGTAFCNSSGCTVVGEPVQVEKGTNFTFANVDAEVVANAHQILSIKRHRKTKRPLFMSDVLTTPGQTDLVITEKLKPGLYEYGCTVHFGMYGVIEIVKTEEL
ncbi:MAG: cupredoxin domain-containing protein [Actinomycetota bacterium]